jgi:hypothetical protein
LVRRTHIADDAGTGWAIRVRAESHTRIDPAHDALAGSGAYGYFPGGRCWSSSVAVRRFSKAIAIWGNLLRSVEMS